MKQALQLLFCLLCLQAQAQLSGTYTVGGTNPDYQNLSQVSTALNSSGISGPVTFNIRPGNYSENLLLGIINGSSATKTITFQAENGDNTSVELYGGASEPVFHLAGTDYVVIKNLTMRTFSTNLIIKLSDNARGTSIDGNIFKGHYSEGVIYSDGDKDNHTKIRNNQFLEGHVGIKLEGISNTNREIGLAIENNTFTDIKREAIYLQYVEAAVIHNNTISSTLDDNNPKIYLSYCPKGTQLTNNKIYTDNGGGIHYKNSNGVSGKEGLVANNFFLLRNNSTDAGLKLEESRLQKVLFNTLHTNDAYAAYLTQSDNIVFYNNILKTNNKEVLYLNQSNNYDINHNAYDSPYIPLISAGANYNDLAAWQAASGQDQNSLETTITFNAPEDFHLNDPLLNGQALAFVEVNTDLDGNPRAAMPDIGADEFNTTSYDVAALAVNLESPFVAGNQPVYVSCSNLGGMTLTGLRFTWEVNGQAQQDYLWTGSLGANAENEIAIGNFTFLSGVNYAISASVEIVGQVDEDPSNNIAQLLGAYTALAGSYTIGGASPDFPDFTSATAAINQGGLGSDVIFEVREGTYVERLLLDGNFPGSDEYSITYDGTASNTQPILQTPSTWVFVVDIAGIAEVNFKGMQLKSKRKGVRLRQIGRVSFDFCIVDISFNTRNLEVEDIGTSFAFSNGEINGLPAIRMVDSPMATVVLSKSTIRDVRILNIGTLVVLDNTLEDLFVKSVLGPEIRRNKLDFLEMVSCQSAQVSRNKITDLSSTLFGLSLTDCNQGEYINNFLKTTILNGSSNNSFYFNSFRGTINTSSVLSFEDASLGNQLVNNIFYHPEGGTCLKLDNLGDIGDSDYNDFYTTGNDLFDFGSNTSLADWQNNTGFDPNSLNIDPQYNSIDDYQPNVLSLKAGTPIASVSLDINGQQRNFNLPTIGAVEFGFQLIGSYTVGGSNPNYATVQDATADLTLKGIAGPVIFNLRDGTYEQIHLGLVDGASASNTVTFQSESGDSTAVSLNSSQVPVILAGTDFIIFRQLGFIQTDHIPVFRIEGGADYVTIENCYFFGRQILVEDIIWSSDSRDDFTTIRNNYFRYGNNSINLQATEVNPEQGHIIENNRIESQKFAIQLSYIDDAQVSGNSIKATGNSNYPVSLFHCNGNLEFSKNKLIVNTNNAMQISECLPTSGNITNNFIYGRGSRVLFLDRSSNLAIYHNTIQVAPTGNSGTSAIFQDEGTNLDVRNNLLANLGVGSVFKVNNNSSFSYRDYNDYFTNGNKLVRNHGNSTTAYANLSAWQAATGLDQNSISVDPSFIATEDYHFTSTLLDGTGINLGVASDIEGTPRGATPDIGAYEFSPPLNGAYLVAFDNPGGYIHGQGNDITINVINEGLNDLGSIEIYWQVNGVDQPPFNWTGNIVSNEASSITIGTYNFQTPTPYGLKAWVNSVNGGADDFPLTDTVEINPLYVSLAGSYTIGGTNPDFATFAEAFVALEEGGVAAPVFFNARGGRYQENLRLREIPNSSATNTVTFQSEALGGLGVYLDFKHNSDGMVLDGTGFVTFRYLIFVGLLEFVNYGSYYYPDFLLHIENGTSNLTIENCVLDGAYYGGKVIKGSGLTENIVIRNNEMNGAEQVISLIGNTNNPPTGLVIEGNSISHNFYEPPHNTLELFSQEGPKIHGNNFASSELLLFNINGQLEFTNNKVVDSEIIFSSCTASLGNESLVANNFMQFDDDVVGIYNSQYIDFYFNNVNATNIGYALRLGNNSQVNLKNNNLKGAALYVQGTLGESDYNNLNGSIYYNGTLSLAQWQNQTGKDLNSINVDPGYASTGDLHVSNPQLAGAGTFIAGLGLDIDGDQRNDNPDIGADEFDFNFKNNIVGILAPKEEGNKVLLLFPNPAKGEIYLEFKEQPIGIQIVDVLGRTVKQVAARGVSQGISLAGLPNGLYYVIVSFNDGGKATREIHQLGIR